MTVDMEVCFVIPRFHYSIMDLPLGVAYLAATVRPKYKTTVLDGTVMSFQGLIRELENRKPDVIGISTHTIDAKFAAQISRFCKRKLDSYVVLGGPHPTIFPEQILRESEADFVVIGEGERTLLELLNKIETNEKVEGIKGIAFLDKGNFVQTSPREPITNIDSLPFPARDLFSKRYFETGCTQLMASRGCPFNCSFCQPTLRALFGNTFRIRSVDNVIEEIELVHNNFGISKIQFHDDTFTIKHRWLEEFCERILDLGLQIQWVANCRADTTPDLNLLSKMKRAGCHTLLMGIESGDEYIRNKILNKKITNEQIITSSQRIRKAGISIHAFFMVGSPGETKKSISKTLKIAEKIRPDFYQVTITTPLPKTYLFDSCVSEGIILDRAWESYDYYKNPIIRLKGFNSSQITSIRRSFGALFKIDRFLRKHRIKIPKHLYIILFWAFFETFNIALMKKILDTVERYFFKHWESSPMPL